jgi:hypothetical protein
MWGCDYHIQSLQTNYHLLFLWVTKIYAYLFGVPMLYREFEKTKKAFKLNL